jgi:hypothetical protein
MATLKNTTINDTGHITMPSGTTAERPSSPVNGMVRYNTSFNRYEIYQASAWKFIAVNSPPLPPFNPGQQAFTSAGTFSWTAPAGVDLVSVVAVGAGGGGQDGWANPGGSGGGLAWRNNIAVEPGVTYTVQVGSGGGNATNGQNSWFQSEATVVGYGGGSAAGQTGGPNNNGRGGGFAFGGSPLGGGGAGGNTTDWGGGGGAGGYTGRGGNVNESGTSIGGGGGSGGSQYSSTHGTGGGGGVGLQGQGPSGNGHYTPWNGTGSPGGGGNGGSGGSRGNWGQNPW